MNAMMEIFETQTVVMISVKQKTDMNAIMEIQRMLTLVMKYVGTETTIKNGLVTMEML